MNRAFTRYQELPDVEALLVAASLSEAGSRKDSPTNLDTHRSLFPRHEPERLLSPSLSSIRNGGEGGRRPGEEALHGSGVHSANQNSAKSLPEGEGKRTATPKLAQQNKSFRA